MGIYDRKKWTNLLRRFPRFMLYAELALIFLGMLVFINYLLFSSGCALLIAIAVLIDVTLVLVILDEIFGD